MMNIAFILPDLKGGGAQKMIINLANEFAERDYQVDLVLLNSDGIYRDLVSRKVTMVEFNKNRSIAALFDLINYFRNQKPSIAISALFHVNLITILAKIFSGNKTSKIILSERNHLTKRLSDMGFFEENIIKFLVKRFYPKADYIVGISNGVCRDLEKIIGEKENQKIVRIHNPVISKDFEGLLNADTVFSFPNKAGLKLVTSGRLVKQKDYPTLLKAVCLYKQQYGDVHLAVLGEGVLKPKIEKLTENLGLKGNVTYLGFIDNPLPVMKQADIYVQSSAWEGFCNVIVEALYCGLKIVSTDCESGPSEILENGKYGVLVPVGDENMLCQALYKLNWLSDNPKMQKARALDFTVQKKADEFESLFK
jgi:glycosyltransferase involved in cell wall biosynthesis